MKSKFVRACGLAPKERERGTAAVVDDRIKRQLAENFSRKTALQTAAA